MVNKLIGAAFAAFAMNAVVAEVVLDYTPPEFLDVPVVANSMLGTTYAYRSEDVYEATTLQITVVTLPKTALSAGEFSAEHCIQLFLTEVARNQSGFFAIPAEKDLEAGNLRLNQVRWTRKDSAIGMTGVLSCGLDGNRYVSINFQDSLASATTTFPSIRKSLSSLNIRE